MDGLHSITTMQSAWKLYQKSYFRFLHASYKPNDIVEIKYAHTYVRFYHRYYIFIFYIFLLSRSPPFELTRRGLGEFPVQVQIHFKDTRNKRIDVLHPIKLDWTQTGLQTFGGETSTQARLIIKPTDYIMMMTENMPTSAIVQSSSSESNINSKYVIASDNTPSVVPPVTSKSIIDTKSSINVENNPMPKLNQSLSTIIFIL